MAPIPVASSPSSLRPRVAARHAAKVAVALLAVQLAGALLAGAQADTQPSWLRHQIDQGLRFRLSARTNVILLVLDGVQTSEWGRLLAQEPSLARAFDGFTYFRNTVADFPITQASIPALLTAQRYDGSRSYAEFVERAYLTDSSLPRALRRAGFLVDFYGLRRTVRCDEGVLSNLRPSRGGLSELAAPLATLLDASFFRCSPQVLKRAIYAEQEWCLRRAVRRLGLSPEGPGRSAAEMADDLEFVTAFERAAGNARREPGPVCKLYHLTGLHPPLRINERGARESLAYSLEGCRRAQRRLPPCCSSSPTTDATSRSCRRPAVPFRSETPRRPSLARSPWCSSSRSRRAAPSGPRMPPSS